MNSHLGEINQEKYGLYIGSHTYKEMKDLIV